MSRTTTYQLDDGELVVDYDIEKDDPKVGYQGGVSVNSVTANGIEIIQLLSAKVLSLIEERCVLTADEEAREAKYAEEDYRRQAMRDDRLMEVV